MSGHSNGPCSSGYYDVPKYCDVLHLGVNAQTVLFRVRVILAFVLVSCFSVFIVHKRWNLHSFLLFVDKCQPGFL